jgi:hypothetical protein
MNADEIRSNPQNSAFHKTKGYEKAENVSIVKLRALCFSIAMLAQGWGCA